MTPKLSHHHTLNNIRTILDWDTLDKARLTFVVCALTGIWFLLCMGFNIWLCHFLGYDVAQYFVPTQVAIASTIIGIYVAFSAALAHMSDWIVSWCSERKLVHVALFLYTLGNFFIAYFFGVMSLIMGVFLVSSPIVAWMLFERTIVTKYAMFAIFMCSAIYLFSILQITPHAALFNPEIWTIDNPFYITMVTPLSITHCTVLLLFAYFSIKHWREREQKVNYLAKVDSLTQIANRRWWELLLIDIISDSKRQMTSFAVVMLDIDYFKHINDEHGHIIGDQVIIALVERLQLSLRSCDVIGRYGGDEFTIVFPNVDAAESLSICERCLHNVRHHPIHTDVGDIFITISMGLLNVEHIHTTYQPNNAFHPDPKSSYSKSSYPKSSYLDDMAVHVHSIITQADNALYQAKGSGRDRVVATSYVQTHASHHPTEYLT